MARILIGNIKGPKGDTGPQGKQGPTGPQGPKGDTGPMPALINNAATTSAGVGALDAAMGKTLNDRISQLYSDVPEYKTLYSGKLELDGVVDIPDIAKYNTYAFISSTYPMPLWGIRWGNQIMAFGADGNAADTIRIAAIKIAIEDGLVTLIGSKVQNIKTGTISEFVITNIYGIT